MLRTKLIPIVLVICAITSFASTPLPVSASNDAPRFSDTADHWARNAIERWSELGVLRGFDGRFYPNDNITRAEMAVLINRMMKFPTPEMNPYSDVSPDDWFYDDMLAMSALSIVRADAQGLCKPGEQVTREEAIYMIATAFGITELLNSGGAGFVDSDDISAYAQLSISRMQRSGFIGGMPDGRFYPKNEITRAEVVTILDNMIDAWISEPGEYTFPDAKTVLITSGEVNLNDHNADYVFVSPGTEHKRVEIDYKAKTGYYPNLIITGWSEHNIGLTGDVNPAIYLHRISDHRALKTIIEGFSGGTGTQDDPVIITTQRELETLSLFCIEDLALYFKLGNDIELSGAWRPLRFYHKNNIMRYSGYGITSVLFFYSHLDGGGYTISGLELNAGTVRSGLFENLYGSVENLRLEATFTGSGMITQAGAIAGILWGTVDNCSVEFMVEIELQTAGYIGGIAGDLIRGEIRNSSSEVKMDVKCGRGRVGGIAGSAAPDAIISGCASNADIVVKGEDECSAGGITGYASTATITDCTSSGSIRAVMDVKTTENNTPNAGGISGVLHGSDISGSMSSANVYAEGGYYSCAGGITGAVTINTSQYADRRPSSVTSSCSTGDVMASGSYMQNNAGGIAGQVFRGTVSTSWASGSISAAGSPGYFNAVGGVAGSCYEDGRIDNSYSTGLVSATDDYWFSYGGFVGRLGGVVTNSYSTGLVERTDSYGGVDKDYVMVGSGRSDGHIVACFDLMDSTRGYPLYVRQEPGQWDVMERLSISDIKNGKTYSDKGWNFEDIWKISGSGYPLPILRGVYEEMQAKLLLPKHLS